MLMKTITKNRTILNGIYKKILLKNIEETFNGWVTFFRRDKENYEMKECCNVKI